MSVDQILKLLIEEDVIKEPITEAQRNRYLDTKALLFSIVYRENINKALVELLEDASEHMAKLNNQEESVCQK